MVRPDMLQHRTVPTEWESLDDRFSSIRGDSRLDQHFDGCRWAEGPVYVPAGRYVVWSDIPNDRMLRWDELTGHVGPFREPAEYSNGNTLDDQGRLVSCHHGSRCVTRTEHDGSITVIADSYGGKRLNSPNDVVVHSDGSIWFTDPAYGIDSDYEGHRADNEFGACYVFRVDPGGALEIVADDFDRPNGLAFSPDESKLYIVDSRIEHIRVFDVVGGKELRGGDIFAECGPGGGYDGIRFDDQGRLWAAEADGVHCFDPDGTLLGKLHVPERVSNLVFGGPQRNRLFITATTSLYSIRVSVNGAGRPRPRG
jgi:gluconolactonase